MISSAGQGYSLLDEEPPRFLRQRVDRLRPSSLIVQKQKIVWSDSIQQECKGKLQEAQGCASSHDDQTTVSTTRLIPRKRYIILRPGNDVMKVSRYDPSQESRKPSIIIPSLSETVSKQPPLQNTVRTISRTGASRAVTQYVLKIPVVQKNYNSSSIKRGVVSQSRADHSMMTMRIPTVPPSMSMGGEYIEEENEEDDAFGCNDHDNLIHEPSFTTKDCECFDSKPIFHCPEIDCFWRGDSEMTVQRHVQSSHVKKTPVITEKSLKNPVKMAGKPKGVRCSECDALAYSRPLLLKHMTQIHGIEAPIMHRTFEDREELQQWLEQLRSTHAVEFVVSSGSKKWGFGLQVHYLTCSRSGEQKERPNKKFARPPRPSIKCGKNCMAYLKIKQNPVTSVLQVEGCLYHSGHMIDGSLIQLTPAEWRKVEAVAELYERDQLAWEIDAERFSLNAVRDVLGHYGRFRLIPDQQLTFLLKQWIKEYNDQRISRETVFPYVNPNIKFNPDNFDIIQTNMIPMLDDFGEYDSNSPASPIPGV